MIDIAELLKNKKFDILIIAGLLALVALTLPVYMNNVVTETIQTELAPLHETVTAITEHRTMLLTHRALTAYKQVDGPLDIKNHLDVLADVEGALRWQESHKMLLLMDRDKTKMFSLYLFGPTDLSYK